MDLGADFKSYQEKITSSLVNVTRTAAQISNQDLSFHRSASEQFSESLDARGVHLLRLTNKLIKVAAKDTSHKPPTLQDRDGIDDNWRKVVDVIDDLLEKADRSLDEFTGVIKQLSPARQDVPEPPPKRQKTGAGIDQWAHASAAKPQLLFEKKVNNYETAPWKPLLTTKPHAIKSLEESIDSSDGHYKHPYAYEIETWQAPDSLYQISEPIPFTPPEQSAPIFVETEDAVKTMLEELKAAEVIAIDLEHNDRNSFVGMVCLMQISTRDKDWIVDTLKPWRENLQVLNEVFADPNIIKVLHGSNSDIIWLQRDLGLYIVGLFDTYYASNILHFPAKSLKYLLERFANFEAQKQYQMADWRIRPLPQELIDYARSDTHFLLYIFDSLKNMLIEYSSPQENLLNWVLESSKREALQVYERPIYDAETGLGPGGWLKLVMQRNNRLTNEQFGVLRALHKWRNQKAREVDEGEQSIISNAVLFLLAEFMPTYKGVWFQRGIGRLSRYVAESIPELSEIVKDGMADGRAGPSVYDEIEKNGDKVGFMFGRSKYPPKQQDEGPRGVGATLQLLNKTGEVPNPPAANATLDVTTDPFVAVRLNDSSFWGSINPLFEQTPANQKIIAESLQSVLPLGKLRIAQPSTEANIGGFDQQQQAPPSIQTQRSVLTNSTNQNNDQHDTTFTIRDMNKKRKIGDVEMSDADVETEEHGKNDVSTIQGRTQKTSTPLSNAEHEVQRTAKQARKEEKRARKAAEAAQQAAAQANMVPFDYASAESMLNARNAAAGDDKGGEPKAKPMNPFAKAMDTSTGARRSKMGKELAGKSHTFRS